MERHFVAKNKRFKGTKWHLLFTDGKLYVALKNLLKHSELSEKSQGTARRVITDPETDYVRFHGEMIEHTGQHGRATFLTVKGAREFINSRPMAQRSNFTEFGDWLHEVVIPEMKKEWEKGRPIEGVDEDQPDLFDVDKVKRIEELERQISALNAQVGRMQRQIDDMSEQPDTEEKPQMIPVSAIEAFIKRQGM